MNTTPTGVSPQRTPLRVWPGVMAAVLLLLVRFVPPRVMPEGMMIAMLGALAATLLILVWWLFFSRAPWRERLGVLGLMIGALWVTSRLVHPSIAGAGMGMLFPILATPYLAVALVAWAVGARRLRPGLRGVALVVTLAVPCTAFTLLRTGGIDGAGDSDFHWRWTPSPEERLLVQGTGPTPTTAPVPSPDLATAGRRPDWPGFRGPERDSRVRGIHLQTNWTTSPPVELWRRAVGPGWSSFAIHGALFYTQEQLGEEELVTCARIDTGEPVWRHRDPVRFWESNAGAGPRSTPTWHRDRVYTLGATGILNALDAATGARVWSRDVAAETATKVPMWGFAGSPLVVGHLVIVAVSGRLAAYDLATGAPRWSGPAHGMSYASPHWAKLGGVEQVLLLTGGGITSVTPTNGVVLWEHAWRGAAMLQPAFTDDGDVLLSVCGPSGGLGTRRIAVTAQADGWTVAPRWTSAGLKPYFNDLVVHRGHAFGFDGSLLACIELAEGKRAWKDGRYGNGQLLLLSDQDLLLVLSERGELALVAATADGFTELARVPAIQGKTWNHPALAGDVLLVRNSEEMAAFRLSLVKPAGNLGEITRGSGLQAETTENSKP